MKIVMELMMSFSVSCSACLLGSVVLGFLGALLSSSVVSMLDGLMLVGLC